MKFSDTRFILGAFLCVILLAVAVYAVSTLQNQDSVDETPIQTNEQSNAQQPATSDPKPVESEAKITYSDTNKLLISKVVSDLDIPWDLFFTPDGAMIVNERSGRLIARLADGSRQTIEADFSDLEVRTELGLMGMEVDPDFSNNRHFYTCQGDKNTKKIKVVTWKMNDDYTQAEKVKDPLVGDIASARIHAGCRLRFDHQGHLWIATGDAAKGTNPQNLDSLAGKILRVDSKTGQGIDDNPFKSSDKARLIYSFGHRNPQGLTWHPESKQMWAAEHGPDIDDEINLLVKGGNYGWDPVSRSRNNYYQQVPMTDKEKYPKAIEAKWSSGDPTLAVSGAIFLNGQWWGSKENWLAVATLKDKTLYLFEFDEKGQLQNRLAPAELNKTLWAVAHTYYRTGWRAIHYYQ